MAIKYPASCLGATPGAWRQLRQSGQTTACGGLFLGKSVSLMSIETSGYTRKNEPLGILMTTLSNAKDDIEATSEAILKSARAMVDAAEMANKGMVDSSRKMRDSTEKLTAQMQKFHTVFASTKFEEQAKAAQSLADALERLAALEERGLLSKVMHSLNS
jgi:hypothetical protein